MKKIRKSTPKGTLYYGWIIVLACLLLSATSTGILSYFSTLFVEPITTSMGFSRAEYMLYSTCATVTSMIVMPFIGALYKKINVKIMIMAGAFIGAGALFTFACSNSLPIFYLGGILGGLGMSTFGGIPISILLSNWFHEKRGLVTGIAFTGSAIVSSVFSSSVSNIIVNNGWRTAYVVLGAAILVIIIPTVMFLIKLKPSDMGLQPYGSVSEHKNVEVGESLGFTRREAMRMPAFWLFAAAVFLMGMFTPGTQQHLVPYWTGSGYGAEKAARFYSIMMFVSMFAKIGMGSIFDKFSAKVASIICGVIAAGAQISLILCVDGWSVLVPVVFFGITTALQVLASTYLTGKFFGQKDYSTLYGLVNTVLFLGVSVGVTFSGLIYDLTSGYTFVWTIYAAAAVVMTVLLVAADWLSIKAFREKLSAEREA